MCGRYTTRRFELFGAAFNATPTFEEFTERPRYNVAPSQPVPVVRLNKDGERVLSMLRWGLIPYWTRGKPKMQPINARDDKVLHSPMYKGAMERRRCLVLADGFYEWAWSTLPKVPHFFRMCNNAPFAFAGLWERWRPEPEAQSVETCLHITTTPNELVAPVHNRMPSILRRDDYTAWLDRGVPPAEAVNLLQPYPANEMEEYVVSTRVNNVANEGPELADPE